MHPLIASRLQAEILRSDGFTGGGAGLLSVADHTQGKRHHYARVGLDGLGHSHWYFHNRGLQ